MATTNGGPSGCTDWESIRQAILDRDGRRCGACGRPEEFVEYLDVHHIVPRGAGGSDRFKNYQLLCRQCHDAAERDGIAPGLEIQSTGRMDQYTFTRFRHFFNEILPAMARATGVRMEPVFFDKKRPFWHISLGDVQIANAVLATHDDEYIYLEPSDRIPPEADKPKSLR